MSGIRKSVQPSSGGPALKMRQVAKNHVLFDPSSDDDDKRNPTGSDEESGAQSSPRDDPGADSGAEQGSAGYDEESDAHPSPRDDPEEDSGYEQGGAGSDEESDAEPSQYDDPEEDSGDKQGDAGSDEESAAPSSTGDIRSEHGGASPAGSVQQVSSDSSSDDDNEAGSESEGQAPLKAGKRKGRGSSATPVDSESSDEQVAKRQRKTKTTRPRREKLMDSDSHDEQDTDGERDERVPKPTRPRSRAPKRPARRSRPPKRTPRQLRIEGKAASDQRQLLTVAKNYSDMGYRRDPANHVWYLTTQVKPGSVQQAADILEIQIDDPFFKQSADQFVPLSTLSELLRLNGYVQAIYTPSQAAMQNPVLPAMAYRLFYTNGCLAENPKNKKKTDPWGINQAAAADVFQLLRSWEDKTAKEDTRQAAAQDDYIQHIFDQAFVSEFLENQDSTAAPPKPPADDQAAYAKFLKDVRTGRFNGGDDDQDFRVRSEEFITVSGKRKQEIEQTMNEVDLILRFRAEILRHSDQELLNDYSILSKCLESLGMTFEEVEALLVSNGEFLDIRNMVKGLHSKIQAERLTDDGLCKEILLKIQEKFPGKAHAFSQEYAAMCIYALVPYDGEEAHFARTLADETMSELLRSQYLSALIHDIVRDLMQNTHKIPQGCIWLDEPTLEKAGYTKGQIWELLALYRKIFAGTGVSKMKKNVRRFWHAKHFSSFQDILLDHLRQKFDVDDQHVLSVVSRDLVYLMALKLKYAHTETLQDWDGFISPGTLGLSAELFTFQGKDAWVDLISDDEKTKPAEGDDPSAKPAKRGPPKRKQEASDEGAIPAIPLPPAPASKHAKIKIPDDGVNRHALRDELYSLCVGYLPSLTPSKSERYGSLRKFMDTFFVGSFSNLSGKGQITLSDAIKAHEQDFGMHVSGDPDAAATWVIRKYAEKHALTSDYIPLHAKKARGLSDVTLREFLDTTKKAADARATKAAKPKPAKAKPAKRTLGSGSEEEEEEEDDNKRDSAPPPKKKGRGARTRA